uniref:Uncharacterized protein n=1 Tax=Rhodnius prolixus TaxID=13249 RepID=T1HM20_RHOPR
MAALRLSSPSLTDDDEDCEREEPTVNKARHCSLLSQLAEQPIIQPAKRRKLKMKPLVFEDYCSGSEDAIDIAHDKRLNEAKNFLCEMKTTLDEESYGMFAKIMRTFHKDSNFDVMLSKLTTLFPVTDTSFRNAFLVAIFKNGFSPKKNITGAVGRTRQTSLGYTSVVPRTRQPYLGYTVVVPSTNHRSTSRRHQLFLYVSFNSLTTKEDPVDPELSTSVLVSIERSFDILLGLETLKQLNATIDLSKHILTTPSIKLKLNYNDSEETETEKPYFNFLIKSRTIQTVKVPIKNIANGDAIIPYRKFKTLEIPESLIHIKNHEAYCKILNPNDIDIELTLKEPLVAENLEIIEPESLNLNNFNYKKLKFDSTKLRTEHMNSEEEKAIKSLVEEYSDIFHIDGDLTFTNQIKHKIRTTDEIPVYTKTYRYPQTGSTNPS